MSFKSALLRKIAVRSNVTTGPRFRVGPGTVIWAPRSLDIGKDVYIGKNVTLEVDGVIGDGVLIANAVNIVGRDDHDIKEVGTAARLTTWVGDAPDRLSRPVHVGSDVWIGAGATILSGVTIGDSAIIGAGAVVVSDVPENSIAVGNPARVVSIRFAVDDYQHHWDSLISDGFRRMTTRAGDQ